MSAPPPIDRRPIPSVAIIGNDAVLAAAPATPVQLAHACLRRGFTVAVPASWGDELIAAEAVRRLATRERGPAVMCVCPFVRSRLLAAGPDLAPFLVSLVSPPVATARYLRAVYGEAGVSITYIGACPGAEDTSIDARLTPDAFLADIAEHGIALSEQPLVFDSIVPPDRRRWGSLPGGAPTAEILWSDTDTRTLVEIDRDDISTDLAQHIIAREHVLLDLAPSLGCACSGSIGSLAPRSARVAVTALEPPRALRPVIDAPATMSLDVPVAPPLPNVHAVEASIAETPATEPPIPVAPPETELMDRRLDEMLGTQVDRAAAEAEAEAEFEAELDGDFAAEFPPMTLEQPAFDHEPETSSLDQAAAAELGDGIGSPFASDDASMSEVVVQSDVMVASETSVEIQATLTSVAAPVDSESVMVHEPEVVAEAEPARATPAASSRVRRRTPVPMPARHPASSIPRATSSDGRALPRAYVAKRRTPSGGITAVELASPDATLRRDEPVVDRATPTWMNAAAPAQGIGAVPAASHPSGSSPLPPSGPAAVAAPEPTTSVPAPGVAPTSPPAAAPAAPTMDTKASTVAAPDTSPSALVVLLVALLALGFFVLRSLN